MSSVGPIQRKRKRSTNYAKPKSSRVLFKRPRPTKVSVQRSTMYVGRGPVANRAMVKLRYHDSLVSNGTTADQVLNLNSIFDPDRTNTGHQPMGRDQWATFYNRYKVMSVSYVLLFSTRSDAINPVKVTILKDNQGTGYTDLIQAAEQNGAFTTIVPVGGQTIKVTGKVNLWTLNGVSKEAYIADDKYEALFSASPGEIMCLHIVHSLITNAAVPANALNYSFSLVYDTAMYDPNPVALS